jgi:hypothetical protein
MSDFENDYTAEDYAGMSDEQFELFKSYGVEMPEGIDALREKAANENVGAGAPFSAPAGALNQTSAEGGAAEGNPPGIPDEPDNDEPDGGDGEPDDDGDEPESNDDGEPVGADGNPPVISDKSDGGSAAPDDADDYAKLQKKERNGELTKREARKLEAIRRQTNEQAERRQLSEKIAELELKLAQASENEAKRTNELLEKYFGQAGLLGDGASGGASGAAAGLSPAPTDGGAAPNDAIALARIASLEQRLQAREQLASEQLMQREREKDVAVLQKIAPGIKTLQDVLNLDKFSEIVKVMQAQVAAGMPRDINKAYTLVYQDEIVEREVARRIQFQDKVDKADAQSKSANVGHIKKLPTPAAREAVITPEMRATAKQYGFVTDDEVREIYKDQLLK